LVNSTLSDVGAKEDVTYDALLGILDRWRTTTVDWDALEPFATLGIDAIALLKGQRDFVAVISTKTDHGQLHLLAVLPDRLKATVVAWRESSPAARRARSTTVCIDMWEGYSTAVEEVLPRAQIVIDRCHVAGHYHDAVDDLRKSEGRRRKHDLAAAAASELKHTLWPFRKRATELDPAARARLDTQLAYSPALRQAYGLREQRTTIFDPARAKAAGLRRIRFWRQRVVKSGLRCFDGFLKLLDTWLDRIANYFSDHQTSRCVAGLNNKLKVLKRRWYGLRNVARLIQRRTRDLEG
jgi:transposase